MELNDYSTESLIKDAQDFIYKDNSETLKNEENLLERESLLNEHSKILKIKN
jgi:hypothetical protein